MYGLQLRLVAQYILFGKEIVAIKNKKMKKSFLLLCVICAFVQNTNAQTLYSIFSYKLEEGFDTLQMPNYVLHRMEKEDGSFCDITIYKAEKSKGEGNKNILNQWNEAVVKTFDRASKKPVKIYSGKKLDGWDSKVAIGNFYVGKKKCVVILNSYSKDNRAAFVTYAFSDRLFQWIVNEFSKNLKMPNKD
jgi:hypothetical protein